MKILDLFFPKKSNWQDVGIFDESGELWLVQMRFEIESKKKVFRRVWIGFIPDSSQQREIIKNVLTHYFKN